MYVVSDSFSGVYATDVHLERVDRRKIVLFQERLLFKSEM